MPTIDHRPDKLSELPCPFDAVDVTGRLAALRDASSLEPEQCVAPDLPRQLKLYTQQALVTVQVRHRSPDRLLC